MTKVLNISINVIFSPEDEIDLDGIYEITDRERAIEIATEEIKKRIIKSVPSDSGCSISMGHKIL